MVVRLDERFALARRAACISAGTLSDAKRVVAGYLLGKRPVVPDDRCARIGRGSACSSRRSYSQVLSSDTRPPKSRQRSASSMLRIVSSVAFFRAADRQSVRSGSPLAVDAEPVDGSYDEPTSRVRSAPRILNHVPAATGADHLFHAIRIAFHGRNGLNADNASCVTPMISCSILTAVAGPDYTPKSKAAQSRRRGRRSPPLYGQ